MFFTCFAYYVNIFYVPFIIIMPSSNIFVHSFDQRILVLTSEIWTYSIPRTCNVGVHTKWWTVGDPVSREKRNEAKWCEGTILVHYVHNKRERKQGKTSKKWKHGGWRKEHKWLLSSCTDSWMETRALRKNMSVLPAATAPLAAMVWAVAAGAVAIDELRHAPAAVNDGNEVGWSWHGCGCHSDSACQAREASLNRLAS